MMHRELHREKTNSQQQQQQQHEECNQSTIDSICSKCGARVSRDMKFCEECGNPLGVCPHCSNPIDSKLALCPHCGRPIHSESCSFCNAQMSEDDRFCPDCGNPRTGIICPECGTTNFRSFCRNCNAPLNEMAHSMIEMVNKDPRIVQARTIVEKMNTLEQLISSLVAEIDADNGDDGSNGSAPAGLSEADKALINQYNELLKMVGGMNIPTQEPSKPQPKRNRQTKQDRRKKLKEAVEEFRTSMEQVQGIFDSILPDPASPPEIQRNFMCACQVSVTTTGKRKELQRTGWVCNLCGCHHKQPSECARPELGGRWIFEEVEVVSKVTKQHTIYL